MYAGAGVAFGPGAPRAVRALAVLVVVAAAPAMAVYG
jgi:hypothetical protein